MPAPYSYDLRSKAIDAVKRGERKTNVCRLFKISRNTLDLWLKREAQTKDVRPLTGYQKGRERKIKDACAFQRLVEDNSSKTQQQIADLWGENLTQQNVSDAFKKLGITRKKNLWVSGKK